MFKKLLIFLLFSSLFISLTSCVNVDVLYEPVDPYANRYSKLKREDGVVGYYDYYKRKDNYYDYYSRKKSNTLYYNDYNRKINKMKDIFYTHSFNILVFITNYYESLNYKVLNIYPHGSLFCDINVCLEKYDVVLINEKNLIENKKITISVDDNLQIKLIDY